MLWTIAAVLFVLWIVGFLVFTLPASRFISCSR